MKAKDILIPAGLLIAWLVFAQQKAINLLNYFITGVKLSWDGITPILTVALQIQNVSNEKYTINSFVGTLTSGSTTIGNVSTFVSTDILPSSQISIPLKIRLSLIGVVSDLVALINQGSGISQTIVLTGYLNASGIIAPINITYKDRIMTEKDYLLTQLPPFSNNQILIEAQQEVKDIVNEVLNAHDYFLEDYLQIGEYFDEGNNVEIAEKLFDFCKKNIAYKVETDLEQTTKSPGAILVTAKGDCKHYAGFIAGNLDAIEKITGKKINWFYRFASYKISENEPAHVFVVMNDKGNEIWIDPVLNSFDSKTIAPKHWIDYKIKNSKMSLKRISGVNESQRLIDSVNELKFYNIIDNNGNVNPAQYVATMQSLPQTFANQLSDSLDYVKKSLNGNMIGDIWSSIGTALSTLFGGGSTTTTTALQTSLSSCQTQLAVANANKNNFSQYLPLILIAGVGIYFLTKNDIMPSQQGFNAVCYANRYPDLKHKYWAIRTDGFFGYSDNPDQNQGLIDAANMASKNAGKPMSLIFSDKFYLFPRDLEKHFNEVGKLQNRVGGCDITGTIYAKEFNTAAYIARYPDIVNDLNYRNDPFSHFTQIGYNQNRIPGYEILNENSPSGMEASGTTQFVSLGIPNVAPPATNPNIVTKTGDQTIVNPPLSNQPPVGSPNDNLVYTPPVVAPVTPPATPLSSSQIMYILGGGLVLLLILFDKKKKTNGRTT